MSNLFNEYISNSSGNTSISIIKLLNFPADYLDVSALPNPQKYGIVFGTLVFTLTIITVLTLLIIGGSFRRIQEQECGDSKDPIKKTLPFIVQQRLERLLIYEELLESRKRMSLKYKKKVYEGTTPLMGMLNSASPKFSCRNGNYSIELPEGYEKEYVKGYLECQSNPGGISLSGMPEIRFESYARAYAGCGINTASTYKRSYSRMYETMACATHRSEKIYRDHWKIYPSDIIGRTIRLEPLSIDRHLSTLFTVTSGLECGIERRFDPYLVWAFFREGPFPCLSELRRSTIFHKNENAACYAIVNTSTLKLIGIIMLTNDDPNNLSICLEPPIVIPSSIGTIEHFESCFLLLDRLFANGYRRIQHSVDTMDVSGKKFVAELGFTLEGILNKDMVNKDSNRDSVIYSMLNSDWRKGARGALYEKLHGKKARIVDEKNLKREEESDVQRDYIFNNKKYRRIIEGKEDIIQKIMWNYIRESLIK